MTRQFCDRCGAARPDEAPPFDKILLITEVDDDGSGSVADEWELCGTCVQSVGVFLDTALPHAD